VTGVTEADWDDDVVGLAARAVWVGVEAPLFALYLSVMV
jgi:hypothetical protein